MENGVERKTSEIEMNIMGLMYRKVNLTETIQREWDKIEGNGNGMEGNGNRIKWKGQVNEIEWKERKGNGNGVEWHGMKGKWNIIKWKEGKWDRIELMGNVLE